MCTYYSIQYTVTIPVVILTFTGNFLQNVINSESWIYRLAEANKNPSANPNWFQFYSFKDVFGVESMNTTEMEKLTHKLAKHHALLADYAR
jgi:hypothetical protein